MFSKWNDNFDYDYVKSKLGKPTITFNEKIHILVVTTRLLGYACGIYECLQQIYNLDVSLADSTATAEHLLEQHKYDYMLIVGHLRYKYNYRIINIAKAKEVEIIMVALLDNLIASICFEYKIQYKLDRFHDIENLPILI